MKQINKDAGEHARPGDKPGDVGMRYLVKLKEEKAKRHQEWKKMFRRENK